MAEYNKEKYFWLKLKEDFFKRHDIKIIKAMPNGKDYVILYLQLLCESLSHNGNLRFSDTIPYDESMLSVVTDTNIDIVRSAIKLFRELGLVEILDDQTIYMTNLNNMIGSTTKGAEKKALQRQGKNELLIEGGQKVDKCPPEIDIDKELELDRELDLKESKKESNKKEETYNTPVRESYDKILDEAIESGFIDKAVKDKLIEFIKHLQLNGKKMINSRLESLVVRLDMAYPDNGEKIIAINRAIVGGYFAIDCEVNND